MHSLFLVIGLLCCVIAMSADELPIIKDSEAAKYAGKSVEVRGLVVSVTISPLGTAFINFGQEYPNQTFAGFVEAGSTLSTDSELGALQGKIIGIMGRIELRQGRPEIRITSKEQIRALGPEAR